MTSSPRESAGQTHKPLDLDAIERRFGPSTKGWVRNGTLCAPGRDVEIDLSANDCQDWMSIKSRRPEADAAFLLAAHDDIRALINEVRLLRGVSR